jgi:hypothetical protein
MLVPILWMRKLRHKEVKLHSQLSDRRQDSNLGLTIPKLTLYPLHMVLAQVA